ncbi:hypothetical protein [Veronia pacifica]|uniref:hypothetical protein n=1 Tax=Veronia pacifica TaxID=1080227 RepID=UPI001FE172CB|nr:hypothetical protein [Veronia pacifica]
MIDMLVSLPGKRPKLFVMVTLLVVFLCSIGLKDLYFRGDYKVFFHDDSPEISAFTEQSDRFSPSQGMVIVLQDPSGDIFNAETLSLIRDLTEKGWLFPYAVRSVSVANFQHTSAVGDDMVVEPLVGPDNPLTAADISHIKDIAMADPNIHGGLISKSGDLALVSVSVRLPETGNLTVQVKEIVDHTNAVIAEAQKKAPNLIFRKGGSIALNDAFTTAAEKDVETLIPMMFFAVMVFLGFLLKSWRFVFATMVCWLYPYRQQWDSWDGVVIIYLISLLAYPCCCSRWR